MGDMEKIGIDKTVEMAWDGVDMVYLSFDIGGMDCRFVPGTGWPEPGDFLPREALALVSKVAAEGICGMELVEVSPPFRFSPPSLSIDLYKQRTSHPTSDSRASPVKSRDPAVPKR